MGLQILFLEVGSGKNSVGEHGIGYHVWYQT